MSVNAISQANGADLLNLLNQSTGQAPTSPAFAASVEVLKKAITQAQSNESQIFAGGSPDSGGQLNVLRVANPALRFCIATRGSGAKDAPEADRGCAGRRKGRPFRFCVDGHPLGYFALARAIRPMHTLVIQLGRLGDVVQTTPLLRELAAAGSGDPGDRIDLLLLHPNQAAVLGIQGIATIRTMGEDLKPLEDQIAAGFQAAANSGASGAVATVAPTSAVRPGHQRFPCGAWVLAHSRNFGRPARRGSHYARRRVPLRRGSANLSRGHGGISRKNWFNVVDGWTISPVLITPRQRVSRVMAHKPLNCGKTRSASRKFSIRCKTPPQHAQR
jgi:hypothetical protein